MNKYTRRRIIFIVMLFLVGAWIYKSVQHEGPFGHTTYYPVQTEYVSKVDSKGYMIFDEIVYTASGDGVVDYNVQEGTRVPKDHTVATLSLMSDMTDLKDELLRVQSAIEYKNQNLNPKLQEYKVSEKEVNLISTIQSSVNEKNLKNTIKAIETLELNTKKNIDISQIGDLINLSSQELEDKREELSREISTNNIVYKSSRSGIVSYKVDGMEELLSKDNLNNLNIDILRKAEENKTDEVKNTVKTGDGIYKIIDNYEYKIAVPIEDEKLQKSLKTGDNVELLIGGTISVKSTLENKLGTESKGVFILKSNEKLMDIGYSRTNEVSIIKDKWDTLVIRTSSIIEKDGQLGVYTKELNGVVRFVPIKVLAQMEIDTLVNIGDENGRITTENGESAATITIYDQIIEDPSNIQEGQVL